MGVRAIQVRLEADRQTLEYLWRTHRVFNERLPDFLKLIFRMRRGECGRTKKEHKLYQTIAQFVVDNSQNAEYLLNSISTVNWTPNTAKKYKAEVVAADGTPTRITGDCWADEAARLSAKKILLYEKEIWLGDLPASMRQIVCRECAAIINGHEELTKNWRREHEEWQARKRNWEGDTEHRLYLNLRPRFEEFEVFAGGKALKRRGRWNLYLDWLRANPDLASWRGGPAVINEILPASKDRIRKARPWKARSVEAEEFWKANPELQLLDKLHGYYEREFVRRRKSKRNPDGFDHRPTFTLPDPLNHPRWFVFNAPQTSPNGYDALSLPEGGNQHGQIQLCLLTGEKYGADHYPSGWVDVRFRADPRLSRFRRVKVPTTVKRGKDKGKIKTKDGYEFFDPHLLTWRPAEISGAKLILKRNRGRGIDRTDPLNSLVAYLVFTVSTDDLPITERAKKIEWSETSELTKSGKRRKSRKLPDGLIACAVDLGLRHVGFATLCEYVDGQPRVLRSRSIWLDEAEGGPDLAHIGRHKRDIRRRRRLRGKPVKGQESHIELQSHITHMGQDRFKKAARAIVNFAWNVDKAFAKESGEVFPRADVIILENLEGLIPDAEKERGINRALVAWNRAQLVQRLDEMAIDTGFKGCVFKISPVGTSQVCSRCGAFGRRYSIMRDPDTHQPNIRFGWVEKLFACPACGYRANADHNASLNLHRKFLDDDQAVAEFFRWRNQPESERRTEIERIDDQLLMPLKDLHNLRLEMVDSPF